MNRTGRVAVFAAGAALFIYLVAHIGLQQLAADAHAIGWMIVPILLVWVVVYLLNTTAWRLTMVGEPRRPAFWPTWTMLISGFALNFVTPLVNLGGEPFKVAALSGWLPPHRAATSVILHWLLRTFGQLLFWLTALGIALAFYAHGPLEVAVLSGGIIAVGGLLFLVWTIHRSGGLETTVRILGRVPLLRRLAGALAARRDTIVEMDRQIMDFYHASPERFFRAVGCEYLSRLVGAVEYYLIFLSLGLPAGYVEAMLVMALQALALNLVFFVPFEVGTKEAVTYLLFARLGLSPDLGVFAAIVTRLRDMLWISFGLLLVWFAGRPRPAPANQTT
jgi:uncharacterized protein (TIRG00374 family)